MIKVVQKAIGVEINAEGYLEILALTEEFSRLFNETKGLPPTRGSFDHRIPLVGTNNPVNCRPYRYSTSKKM